MFHLYFGAFDIVLYRGATYSAMVFAKAICEERPTEILAISSSEAVSRPAPQLAAAHINQSFAPKAEVASRVTVGVK